MVETLDSPLRCGLQTRQHRPSRKDSHAHGSFQNYLHSHADFDALIKDLIKNFKFLGRMCFYTLYIVGEDVPDHTEYMESTRK